MRYAYVTSQVSCVAVESVESIFDKLFSSSACAAYNKFHHLDIDTKLDNVYTISSPSGPHG